MSLLLTAKVWLVRRMLDYNELSEHKSGPTPSAPRFVKEISSTSPRGFAKLHFYTNADVDLSDTSIKHPVIIDVHGGGYSSGSPSMDARFIDSLLALPCRPVVVAVQYSFAPEYPYPAGLLDVVAAIEWLAQTGSIEYNLESARMALVGFSAGAAYVAGAPIYLKQQGRSLQSPLRGLVYIYGNPDSRLPRKPSPTALSNFLYSVWDESYRQKAPIESPLVSIAAADDETLRTCLPDKVGLYPAEEDPYCQPTEEFRARLQKLGKSVTGFAEPGVGHAFDKYPIKPETEAWAKRQEWFSKIAADLENMLTS